MLLIPRPSNLILPASTNRLCRVTHMSSLTRADGALGNRVKGVGFWKLRTDGLHAVSRGYSTRACTRRAISQRSGVWCGCTLRAPTYTTHARTTGGGDRQAFSCARQKCGPCVGFNFQSLFTFQWPWASVSAVGSEHSPDRSCQLSNIHAIHVIGRLPPCRPFLVQGSGRHASEAESRADGHGTTRHEHRRVRAKKHDQHAAAARGLTFHAISAPISGDALEGCSVSRLSGAARRRLGSTSSPAASEPPHPASTLISKHHPLSPTSPTITYDHIRAKIRDPVRSPLTRNWGAMGDTGKLLGIADMTIEGVSPESTGMEGLVLLTSMP